MDYEVDIELEKQSPINVDLKLETKGITEHNLLNNRDLSDQHPISAITGLQDVLNKKADIDEIPTKTSDLVNDNGYITNSALSGYATQTWVENKGYLTEIPVEYVTYSELNAKGYQTAEDVENAITAKNYTTMSAVEAKGYITGSALVGYATENYVSSKFVPQSRTINGKSLSENINLTASDVGATTQAYVNAGLSTKQNVISDLADIRSGAELGSTALQNITSRMVANALGFVPYNSSNPNKYVNKTDLTTKQDILTQNNAGTDISIVRSLLPAEYTQLTYLGADDVIVFDIKTTNNSTIECSWIRNKSGGKYLYLSDSNSSGTTNTTAYTSTASANWRFGNRYIAVTTSSLGEYLTIQNKNGVVVNGNTVGTYGTVSTFTSNANLMIFSNADKDILYIKYIKHYDGDVLTLYAIPCKRKSDNSYGFYDIISNKFYTNETANYGVGEEIELVISFTNDSGFITAEDIEGLVSKDYVDNELETKQDRLIEGEGIILDNATNKATGIGSVSFANAISDGIVSVELSGLCEQKTTPTPLNPIPVLCNNGEILFRYNGDVLEMYVSGTTEKVKDSLNNIVTAENLLGLGNYQDMQDIISGKVSRKIVVQALKGTERWNTGVNNNNIRYYYMSLSPEARYENLVMLSNCYNEARLPVAQFDDFSCTIRSSRTIYITDNRFSDVDGFSSFLAEQYANGTPVYIVLALLEPIIETVSQQQLTTQRGNNTISISQGDISNLALSVTYKTNSVLISVDNNNYVSKSVFDAEIARLEALIKG